MPRFVPIVIEVNDSRAAPRVKGLKNAFDDLEKSENKAARGFTNVFDSTTKVSTQSIQKVDGAIKQLGNTAVKTANETKSAFKQIENQAEATAKGSSSAFSQYFSAAFFATLLQNILSKFLQFSKDFVGKSVELAQEAKNAFLGLQSVAVFKGVDSQQAQEAVNNLLLVKGGIISNMDAAVALKNILQKGFGLEDSIRILEIFSDTMAFGKQAALSYGEAIRSGSEGLKNDNAILLDNIGLSKNQSVILKERGFALEDLGDRTKGAAAKQALLNGLIVESQGQLGDAAKLTETYTGVVAAQDKAYQDLQRTIGEIIITNPALVESNKIVTEQINETTAAIQRQDSESGKFAQNTIYWWARIKANLLPFLAFWKNLIHATLQGILVVITTAVFGVLKGIEFLIDRVRSVITDVLNLFVDGINKLTSMARSLPGSSIPGNPLNALQQIGPITRFAEPATDLGSNKMFDNLEKALNKLSEVMGRVNKAAEEGIEADRRIDEAFRRNTASSGTSVDRVSRAAALATGAPGGSGKKVADDFKSIANVIPVPTPSDPKLKGMIEDYAGTFGIPTWVAFAQIWNESRFNRNAMSPKGAKGLTQIMPGTAAQYGVSYKNLNDPAVALTGWGKIMSSLYAKYGSWDLALLAYHQGEKPVDRLVAIIQRGEVDESKGGFAAAAKRAGVGPAGRKYLADINLFKSNPVPEQESPFQGMKPQDIVKTVLTTDARGNARTIPTDETPALAQLPIDLERQWTQYYESAEQGAKALAERRKDLDAEYFANFKNLLTEVGHLELDISQIRRENADDQFTEQRRLLLAKTEEKDLLLGIRQAQDEIANGPYNESLRIQLALLHDIADIRRRDEDAIKEQNRAQLELADAEVFHAQQARAIVLGHLAQSRSQTEVFADAIVDAYESINDVVLQGVQKLTGGIRILDSLISGLITRITNRLFQKLLDVLLPGSGTGASGGGGGGFFGNLFGLSSPAQAATGGFAGGPAGVSGAAPYFGFGGGGITNPQQAQAAALANIFGGGGGITPPTSLTAQLQQQSSLTSSLQAAAGQSPLATAAGGGATNALTSAPMFAGIAPLLPFLGAGIGAQLGSGSRLGTALGIAGGGLAGLLGIAIAPTSIGGLGAGLAGLSTLGLIAGPAAAALIIGAIILSRNAARRRDERTRNQSMLDSLGQLNEILRAVKTDRMDGGAAIAAAAQVRSQYLEQMNQLKDGKTRRIAVSDVSRLDVIINQIRNEANGQLERQERDRRLVPEFAHGLERGLVPDMGGRRTLIKVRPGERVDDVGMAQSFFVPGVDRGVDSVYTVATPGSRVLTKPQQARVPSYANGTPAALPSAESDRPIAFTVNINLPGMKPGVLAEQIVKSPEGREAIVKLVQIENRDGRFN